MVLLVLTQLTAMATGDSDLVVARKAFAGLSASELAAMASTDTPSMCVMGIGYSLCVLLGQKPSWPLSQHILTSRRFLTGLLRLSPEGVRPDRRVIATRLLTTQRLVEKALESGENAAIVVAQWLAVILGLPLDGSSSGEAASPPRPVIATSGGAAAPAGGGDAGVGASNGFLPTLSPSSASMASPATTISVSASGHLGNGYGSGRGHLHNAPKQASIRGGIVDDGGSKVEKGAKAVRRRSLTGGMWTEGAHAEPRVPGHAQTGGSGIGDHVYKREHEHHHTHHADRGSPHRLEPLQAGGRDRPARGRRGSAAGRRGSTTGEGPDGKPRRRSKVMFNMPSTWTKDFNQYVDRDGGSDYSDADDEGAGGSFRDAERSGGRRGRRDSSSFTPASIVHSHRREARRQSIGDARRSARDILAMSSSAAIAQARFALSSIAQSDLGSLAALTSPSPAEVAINAALCLIFKAKPSREALQFVVTNAKTLSLMQAMSPYDLPERVLQIVDVLCRRHAFGSEANYNKTQAVRVVAQWIAALTANHESPHAAPAPGRLPALRSPSPTKSPSKRSKRSRDRGGGSSSAHKGSRKGSELRREDSLAQFEDFCGLSERDIK